MIISIDAGKKALGKIQHEFLKAFHKTRNRNFLLYKNIYENPIINYIFNSKVLNIFPLR